MCCCGPCRRQASVFAERTSRSSGSASLDHSAPSSVAAGGPGSAAGAGADGWRPLGHRRESRTAAIRCPVPHVGVDGLRFFTVSGARGCSRGERLVLAKCPNFVGHGSFCHRRGRALCPGEPLCLLPASRHSVSKLGTGESELGSVLGLCRGSSSPDTERIWCRRGALLNSLEGAVTAKGRAASAPWPCPAGAPVAPELNAVCR